MRRFQSILLVLFAGMVITSSSASGETAPGERFVKAVELFAGQAIEKGRDIYGEKHTPLFVDGMNVDTLEPVVWKNKGQTWIMSNGATQQNFYRTLVGLSALTEDKKYRNAAAAALEFWQVNCRAENGLIKWGGHLFYDLASDEIVGEGNKHELKNHIPYYEFMWELHPQKTKRYIEAIWGAHIIDWSNLDMNRHGRFKTTNEKLWDNEYKGGPVFFVGKGLTFLSAGTDMIYAAAMLSDLSGNPAPLEWATRMAYRYVETRNPKTGLGGLQYNRYKHGDRAEVQFAEDLPGHVVYEGTLNVPRVSHVVTGTSAIVRLKLAEKLGPRGAKLRKWALEDLKAFGKWAFDKEECKWIPMLTDGTYLDGFKIKRKGYYKDWHNHFKKQPVLSYSFWAYSLGWRMSKDPDLWEMARTIGIAHGLGDIGSAPGVQTKLIKGEDATANPHLLFGLLEIYRATGNKTYLDMAESIGDSILENRFVNGLFVDQQNRVNAKLDAPEPLALLHLAAAMQNKPNLVPDYWNGKGFFQCNFDGIGRTWDWAVIYEIDKETK